ncbi:hypothetical protein HG15A2_45830 [Adhaeretor mobilis]|uniref:Uncharacterized protein n=1 Tax=Adhaeretor mobilis TaxID=1930276 RepID=A0A517N290_9BACT|nr:hypothetical protein HG15A2_45830 [Adhaeretor mobilis]
MVRRREFVVSRVQAVGNLQELPVPLIPWWLLSVSYASNRLFLAQELLFANDLCKAAILRLYWIDRLAMPPHDGGTCLVEFVEFGSQYLNDCLC